MAATLASPGTHCPSDLKKIIVVSTTGIAQNGDPALVKSFVCRVLSERGNSAAVLDKDTPLRRERH
jgi:hypothetical protein